MELRRAYGKEEGLIRLWAEKGMELCAQIDDEEELAEYIEPVKKALEALVHDRRILVLGEAGSGKSSILADLADAPVIARVRMETQHYLCWRYTCRDGDAMHSRFIASPNLEGLELVDTADIRNEEVRRTCELLMTGADVILGVLDARTAETSPLWEILAGKPPEERKSWMLVATQINRLDAKQTIVIKQHLRELAEQHAVKDVPMLIYPREEKAVAEALRDYVAGKLKTSGGLLALLRLLAERASDMVQSAGRVLSFRESISRTDTSFMDDIEREISKLLQFQTAELGEYGKAVLQTILQVLPDVRADVRYAMGNLLSPITLLRLESMGGYTNSSVCSNINDVLQQMEHRVDMNFIALCANQWKAVRPRVKTKLKCDIGDFPYAVLEKELDSLREKLCRELYESIAAKGLRAQLIRIYVVHAGWMQTCLSATFACIMVGGLLGFLGQDIPGICCVVLAGLIWCGGCIAHTITTRRICARVDALVRGVCNDALGVFRTVLEDYITSRVTAYRQLYIQPRQKLARQEKEFKPLQTLQGYILTQIRGCFRDLDNFYG